MRFILVFLFLPAFVWGQSDNDMDELARSAPARMTNTVDQLATYFLQKAPDERSRIRAIFAWITLNVRYLDTSDQSEIWATPEHIDRQRPQKVLVNRTAVCQGFANLFQALAGASGIECQVVTGIVKNADGEVERQGHAWNAARINGAWALFDPTWSLPEPEYPWTVNGRYFMMSPEQFVMNHLPDDPAWQLLENPLHEEQFRYHDEAEIIRYLADKNADLFSYQDTLDHWIALDSTLRMTSAENRVMQFNGRNERVVFALGQNYWGLFYDLRARLDTLADRSILDKTIALDTNYFAAQLRLLDNYHRHARFHFSKLTEPERIAQAERFYTPEDVDAMIGKLAGDMWAAVFVHYHHTTAQSVNEDNLESLAMTAEKAREKYDRSIQWLDCRKLRNSCFEIWHNLSLMDIQLGERSAFYVQSLLNDKNAAVYLRNAEEYMQRSRRWLEQANHETEEMMRIPPAFAFGKDRLLRIRQDLLTLRFLDLQIQRTGLDPMVENALKSTGKNPANVRNAGIKLGRLVDELNGLAVELEDQTATLDPDFIRVTVFNLNQEVFPMQLNLASLQLRMAIDQQEDAVRQNTLETEKKRILSQVEKAWPYWKEASQTLDDLKRSGIASANAIEQRRALLKKLSASIQEFTDSLNGKR